MRKSVAKVPSQDSVQLAFGAAVRQLRVGRGLTQEGLAEATDLHFTYVSQVERGLRNVSLHIVHRLAFGLGMPASALMKASEQKLEG